MTVLRPYQEYVNYIRTIEVNTILYISGCPFQQYFSYIRTIKVILIYFPMNYRDFSVKINGENISEITIFIFTV